MVPVITDSAMPKSLEWHLENMLIENICHLQKATLHIYHANTLDSLHSMGRSECEWKPTLAKKSIALISHVVHIIIWNMYITRIGNYQLVTSCNGVVVHHINASHCSSV